MTSCNIKGAFFVFKTGRTGKQILVHDISKELKNNTDAIDPLILFNQETSVDIIIDGKSYTFFNIASGTLRDSYIG